MEFFTFFKVIGIGLSVAAAVGPISLLCVQRTLQRGWRYGIASGIGVATADALYGLIGGLGLTVITNFLVSQQRILQLAGGGILIYLGVRTLLATREIRAAKEQNTGASGYLGAYTSILLLTLSNPMTILSFVAIYAGIGVLEIISGWTAAAVFSLAIFIGSALWWLILVSGISYLRSRFEQKMLLILNRISGALIAGFGIIILWKALLS